MCQVNSDRNTDYYLKVESHSNQLKERSMNEQYRARFEAGLQQIADKDKKRIVTAIKCAVKEGVDINARSGVYFQHISIQAKLQENVWQFYNTIREIESTFRVLKTDLYLRPIHHQKDENTMAQLHLGLLGLLAGRHRRLPT